MAAGGAAAAAGGGGDAAAAPDATGGDGGGSSLSDRPTRQHRQASFPDIISNSIRRLSNSSSSSRRRNNGTEDDDIDADAGEANDHSSSSSSSDNNNDFGDSSHNPTNDFRDNSNSNTNGDCVDGDGDGGDDQAEDDDDQQLSSTPQQALEEPQEQRHTSTTITNSTTTSYIRKTKPNRGRFFTKRPSVKLQDLSGRYSSSLEGDQSSSNFSGSANDSSGGLDTVAAGNTTSGRGTNIIDSSNHSNGTNWTRKFEQHKKRRNSALELRDESLSDELLAGRRVMSREDEMYEEIEVTNSSWNNFHIAESLRNKVQEWQKKRQIYREDYPRTMDVLNQAMWYLGVFYVTHIWSTSNRIVQMLNLGDTQYWLILGHAWFDPFQGFLNYVVYQRPRYLFIRESQPDLGRTGAMLRALKFSYIKQREVDAGGSSAFSESSATQRSTSLARKRKSASQQIVRGYTGSTGGAGVGTTSSMVRDSRESLVSQLSFGVIPEVSSELMSHDASGSMRNMASTETTSTTKQKETLCASLKFDENDDVVEDENAVEEKQEESN